MNLPPAYKAKAMRLMRIGLAADGDEFIAAADGLLQDAGLDVRRLPHPVQAAGKAILGALTERVGHGDASTGVRAIAKRFGGPERSE